MRKSLRRLAFLSRATFAAAVVAVVTIGFSIGRFPKPVSHRRSCRVP
jgi:hypothetical protein